MKTLILFITLLSSSYLFAQESVLFKNKTYTFKEKNFNELVELGEYLGRESFSKEDKKNLKEWAIEDVKSAPKASKTFYNTLSKTLIPTINSPKTNPIYRVKLYKQFVAMFRDHPEYSKSPNNFLAIVNHYNPPKKELREYEMLYNNFLLQAMLNNQKKFNRIMKTFQQQSKIMTDSIAQQSTRDSITLSGGTIRYEDANVIYTTDAQSMQYGVSK